MKEICMFEMFLVSLIINVFNVKKKVDVRVKIILIKVCSFFFVGVFFFVVILKLLLFEFLRCFIVWLFFVFELREFLWFVLSVCFVFFSKVWLFLIGFWRKFFCKSKLRLFFIRCLWFFVFFWNLLVIGVKIFVVIF